MHIYCHEQDRFNILTTRSEFFYVDPLYMEMIVVEMYSNSTLTFTSSSRQDKNHQDHFSETINQDPDVKKYSVFRYGGTRSHDRQQGKGPYTP